jgi:hypothetical protein
MWKISEEYCSLKNFGAAIVLLEGVVQTKRFKFGNRNLAITHLKLAGKSMLQVVVRFYGVFSRIIFPMYTKP